MLAQTVIRLIKDIENEKENDIKSYSRLAQAPTFKNLRMTIANFALIKVPLEWDDLCRIAPSNLYELGNCECPLLLQFGLPCRHYLFHFYVSGEAIPRSLCHPRWWLNGGLLALFPIFCHTNLV